MRGRRSKEDRRRELTSLAREVLAVHGQAKHPVDLHAIVADHSEVVVHQVDLRGECDGLLRWHERQGRFHLFYHEDPFRHRFNLAHEIAHLCIDWHCELIRRGSGSHISNHKLLQNDPMEREADFLAGCLLIPDPLFNPDRFEPTFSDASKLKEEFNTSLAVAIRRIVDCSHIRSGFIMSRNGRVAWSYFSDGMQETGMGFIKHNSPVPDESVTKQVLNGAGKSEGPVRAGVWYDRIDSGEMLWEEFRDFPNFGYGITILSVQDD
jgi:Zn-dependent peptidase ImmA (M78 family)